MVYSHHAGPAGRPGGARRPPGGGPGGGQWGAFILSPLPSDGVQPPCGTGGPSGGDSQPVGRGAWVCPASLITPMRSHHRDRASEIGRAHVSTPVTVKSRI